MTLAKQDTGGIIVAYHHSNDSFTVRHSKRSTTQITLYGKNGS